MEIDPRLTVRDYHPIFLSAAASFIQRGRLVIGVPSEGVTVETLMRTEKLYEASEGKFFKQTAFFIESKAPMKEFPNVIKINPRNYEGAFRVAISRAIKLTRKFREPPFVGVDGLVRLYGVDIAANLLAVAQDYMMHSGRLMILIAKPVEPGIIERLAPAVDIHLKVTRKYECIAFYGIKPGTPLYALQIDPESETPLPEIISIV